MNAVHTASKMTTSPVIVLIKNRINFPATILLKCTLHILARQVQPIFNNHHFSQNVIAIFPAKTLFIVRRRDRKTQVFLGANDHQIDEILCRLRLKL
ncbi:hypothetical protein AT03_12310 [Hafnia alvei FB1]|uniref:Uncharacterized protein n=1 Tax=Hafnia alvei FB1 TaxID=1453496 RepID=A0A097R2Z2_HAFAL|nr:hypothetical protein AT03_12310 [Hafnia alvei FB1]